MKWGDFGQPTTSDIYMKSIYFCYKTSIFNKFLKTRAYFVGYSVLFLMGSPSVERCVFFKCVFFAEKKTHTSFFVERCVFNRGYKYVSE